MLRHGESYVPGEVGLSTRGDQPNLFDQPQKPVVEEAPSRRSDPPTSSMAAANVVSSGRASMRNGKILAFLRANGGQFTYREIAGPIGEDPTEIMRRLNTLRQKLLVEKCGFRNCRVNGNLMTTWRAKQ
jgi:hypothetical protein